MVNKTKITLANNSISNLVDCTFSTQCLLTKQARTKTVYLLTDLPDVFNATHIICI